MDNNFTSQLPRIISTFEQQGLVTRTFRRLDLSRQLAIIDAILEESSINSPAEMNIKKVAARAEVSIGSLYQYFNNKEGLLNFAIALTVQQTISSFNEFLPYLDQLSFEEAFNIYLSYGLEWGEQEQQFVRFFAKAAYENDEQLHEQVVKPISGCMLGIIQKMVELGQDSGEIRSDLNSDMLSRLLHAMSIMLGDPVLLPYLNHYFQVVSDNQPTDAPMKLIMDILHHGIFSHRTEEQIS